MGRKMSYEALVEGTLDAYGTLTTINGIATKLPAVWNTADASRVQLYLNEAGLYPPAYDVTLPARALKAPWNLAMGSSLINSNTGWELNVRHIDGPGISDETADIYVLGVTTAR